MKELDLTTLRSAVAGSAVAVRSITRLQPAGGPGDKVFPPTYMKEKGAETKYALERRRIEGRESLTVLLDSVASQANRMEEALLEAWRRKEIDFPLVEVDFSGETGLEDIGQITALQTPHRIADALLRDSLLDGQLFRFSDPGRAFTDSRPNHATGMYRYCPTALIFGVWDSTGPKGGLGAKFQRCMVSEIIGVDVVGGVKTASRLDPLGIEKKAGPVFQHPDPKERWTLDESVAMKEGKGKPVPVGGSGDKGSPSAINHGNIPPTIDSEAGGVTMSHALQTAVFSLAGLRRLRFVTDIKGAVLPAASRDEAELAARTALAALGLAGLAYLRQSDFDLRSRSLLVPEAPSSYELLGRDGQPATQFALTTGGAAKLLAEAASAAQKLGLGWDRGPITLKPAPKLAALVRKSRELTQAGSGSESD
ncbi:MAG: type I-U CRISPR-associated protein Cas7 [Candidatus Eisenbacteria bacterium]|nr:type I-U CRISPR-associated protein Cas7 [Candidatus Eisenbacteria bacterium]